MIELKLTFASQAELLAFFAGTKQLVSSEEKAAVAAINADTKVVQLPKQQAKPAATQPVTEAAPAATPEPAAASPSDTPVSYDDVKKLVMELAKKKGAPAAQAVLQGLGVAKGPELKPEQYPAAVEQLQAALA